MFQLKLPENEIKEKNKIYVNLKNITAKINHH